MVENRVFPDKEWPFGVEMDSAGPSTYAERPQRSSVQLREDS